MLIIIIIIIMMMMMMMMTTMVTIMTIIVVMITKFVGFHAGCPGADRVEVSVEFLSPSQAQIVILIYSLHLD